MNMDWKNAAPKEFEIYQDGSYCVEIKGWKKEVNKNSGNIQIRFDGVIQTPTVHANKSIVEFITLTEASQWRLALFIDKCLGIDVKTLPPMDTDSQEFENLLSACKGRKMFWQIYIDTYDGKTRNKTTQKDPYESSKGNPAVTIGDIDDVPEWVREK